MVVFKQSFQIRAVLGLNCKSDVRNHIMCLPITFEEPVFKKIKKESSLKNLVELYTKWKSFQLAKFQSLFL